MSENNGRRMRGRPPLDAIKPLDEDLDDDTGDDPEHSMSSRRGKRIITLPFVTGSNYPYQRRLEFTTHDDD